MFRLFTVRWPILARFEAVLLFVALLAMLNKIPALHAGLDDLASIEAENFAIPPILVNRAVLAFLAAGPYLGLMVAVDRMLGVRNGFAWLSIVAIAIWAGLGAIFAADLVSLLPVFRDRGTAAIAAASMALLIHARPLAIGLVGRGFAGPRRAAAAGAMGSRPGWTGSVPQNPWLAPDPGSATDPAPTRGSGGILLAGLAAAFAVVMFGLRYHPDSRPGIASMKEESPGLPLAPPRLVPPERLPALPRALPQWAAPAMPPPASLPQVWAPEGAVAALRRPDGFFAVRAEVNNQPVSMLFDTGASWVTLRAEDAARLGIDAAALRFSIQSRTANGIAAMAPVMIATMSIGPITINNVPAVVAKPGTLQENLLGQSFLRRLRDYTVESDRVIFHGN